MTTVPRTITLRARLVTPDLVAGALVAGVNGRTIYRILAVTRVRTAGDPAADRVRLVLRRLARDQVGAGETVSPWPRAPRPARRTAAPGSGRQLLAAAVAKAVREGRVAEELAAIARAGRIGRDAGYEGGRDYGPGLRLAPVHARRRGALLREADVLVEDAPDPDSPNRVLRRARRVDPLVTLHRAGTISGQGLDAVELLREDLQAAEGSIPSNFSRSEVHLSAHQRTGIGDREIQGRTRVRRAMLAVSVINQPICLWIACGGTIGAYVRLTGVRHDKTTAARLAEGVGQLVQHYYGAVRMSSEIRSASFGAMETA
jgi:hypothetical protein